MKETHTTFCRFCHAFCGIKVTVEDGRAVKVVGDKDNPLYHGYSCIKGRSLPEQHYHPDRLLHSQTRVSAGRYEPIPAAQAMDRIADRLQSLIGRYGPRSIALYSGTYTFMYPAGSALAAAFMAAIGSPMHFTSGTIDQPGKPIATALHGRWGAGAQPFADADVCMLIGTNPLLSMYSGGALPATNPAKHLHDAKKRGLKLVVIDPRCTETAAQADVFLQPRPGEDPTILAGIIRIIVEEQIFDRKFVAEEVDGLEILAAAVAPFTPDYVERRADVPADQLIAAARMFATASKGNASTGTGPGMASRGTLTEYLTLVLNTLCGRWARAGEPLPNPNVLSAQPSGKAQARPRPERAFGFGEKLRVRGITDTAAGLQTCALAEEILLPGEGQVKALISVGGNPVAAWPDQLLTLDALQTLELCVTIDIKMSATAKLADFVIAPKLSLEVPGITLENETISRYAPLAGYRVPYAQWGPKVIDPPPGSDLIEEWEFFYGLGQRMGLDLSVAGTPLDMRQAPTTEEIYALLCASSRIPLSEVQSHAHGHIFDDPSIRVKPKDQGWPHRLDVGSQPMMEELALVAGECFPARELGLQEQTFPFRLISRRMHEVYNSSGRDIPALVRNRRYNPAFMHPNEMRRLGLDSGDIVEISSTHASILGVVEDDSTLRDGVISMAHAFGDAPEHDPDVRNQGGNTGRLIDNRGVTDRFSRIPLMSAIPVNIKKVPSLRAVN